jgi:DHA1 family bicyclomycin/chloramphenicol resistance-like MFS transporter
LNPPHAPFPSRQPALRPGFGEFVALMAALMASNAMAIDSMLPALPAIAEALGVTEENRRQLVITFYLLGFGVAQIGYGPLSDRFGRKGLLVGGLLLYAVFATLAGLAGSFELLLAARAMQGVAAAATRVLVVSIVRDRFHGPAMARVMSLTMIVFMIVPILAPFFGQAVIAVGSWRHIFIGLGAYGTLLAIWVLLRLPETLPPERRRALSFGSIAEAARLTLVTRQSVGNAAVTTLAMGALFSFINSIQQVVEDVLRRPALLPVVFACVAGPMALSSYANSKLVMRLGSRQLLLRALACFTAAAGLHLAVAATVGESLSTFIPLQAATMACFGLIGANAGALAMEPLGHVAGTASSLQGVLTTIGGALIGFAVGQSFDGTTIPLLVGFTACGALGFAVAIWANRDPCRDSHDEAEIDIQETATRPG